MTTLSSFSERSRSILFLLALAALTTLAAFLSRGVVNDDPYINYRYARNLAQGTGFVYNAGEPILSTTAPLYALLLAALALLRIEPPVASLIAGAVSTFAASALVYRLGKRAGRAAPGAIAAALLATSPLIWMAAGMESSLYLALALAAFNAATDRRWRTAGLAAACATLVRGDGLLVVALVALAELLDRQRAPLRSGLSALVLIVPLLVAATVVYGGPFPATLRAKVLQANLGITGFFPGARFLDGIAQLAKAYFEQAWLYALALPCIALGLARLRQHRWVWLLVTWGALQLIGYTALGVAPYRWYYIPLLPAIYALIGVGIDSPQRTQRTQRTHREFEITLRSPAPLLFAGLRSLRFGQAASIGLILLFLAAQARSIWEVYRSTDPGVPRSDLIGIDALPETSGSVYQQVGEWLREQTAPDASVGVMEVGVIGYYAERRMVDFLGLLQPEVADALGRRDIFWSIPHTLPDYLVLTAINPLYSYDLLADTWFQATYSPAAQFEDTRFWGSPLKVYRRRRPAIALETQAVDQRAGPMQLSGYATEPILIQANTPMRIRLEWSKPDATSARVSVSLIGPGGRVIAGDTRAYDTAAWLASGGSVYHTLVTGPEAPPGRYRARIQVVGEDQAGEMLVGAWKSPLGGVSLPRDLAPRADRFGEVIDLIGYRLEPGRASANAEVTLTLYWQSRQVTGIDYTVFVHVESDDDRLVLAADGQPRGGDYPTSIWAPAEIVDDPHVFRLPAGTYHLKVGLYRLETGERLMAGGDDQVDLGLLTVE